MDFGLLRNVKRETYRMIEWKLLDILFDQCILVLVFVRLEEKKDFEDDLFADVIVAAGLSILL